jgi:hypothetical protein
MTIIRNEVKKISKPRNTVDYTDITLEKEQQEAYKSILCSNYQTLAEHLK